MTDKSKSKDKAWIEARDKAIFEFRASLAAQPEIGKEAAVHFSAIVKDWAEWGREYGSKEQMINAKLTLEMHRDRLDILKERDAALAEAERFKAKHAEIKEELFLSWKLRTEELETIVKLTEALETLRVAVNDKVKDPGATAFCERILNANAEVISRARGEKSEKVDIAR